MVILRIYSQFVGLLTTSSVFPLAVKTTLFLSGRQTKIRVLMWWLISKIFILPMPDHFEQLTFIDLWFLISFRFLLFLSSKSQMTCFSFLATVFFILFLCLRFNFSSFFLIQIFYFIYYWFLPVSLMCLLELFFELLLKIYFPRMIGLIKALSFCWVVVNAQDHCPRQCTCVLTTVRCRGIAQIPRYIPQNVTVLDLR